MARITDYQTLKDAINAVVDNDSAPMQAYIDVCIQSVEKRIDYLLRTEHQEETWDTVINTEYTDLPDGFLGFRRIIIERGGVEFALQVESTDTITARNFEAAGTPAYYAIVNNQIQVYPSPDTDYTIKAVYWKEVTPLDDINTTNWLVTRFPMVYLHGALAKAHLFLMDQNQANVDEQLFMSGVSGINDDSKQKLWRGSPLTSRIR